MKNKFSNEQIERLKADKNILTCSSKIITFTEEFKVMAIKRYSDGLTAIQIFKEAGIDIDLIGKRLPKNCIRNWKIQLKQKGVLSNKRGHGTRIKPKKIVTKNKEERIKYLEAENEYLKRENAFLAKLRAKERAE